MSPNVPPFLDRYSKSTVRARQKNVPQDLFSRAGLASIPNLSPEKPREWCWQPYFERIYQHPPNHVDKVHVPAKMSMSYYYILDPSRTTADAASERHRPFFEHSCVWSLAQRIQFPGSDVPANSSAAHILSSLPTPAASRSR